jgi:hypothetical protein
MAEVPAGHRRGRRNLRYHRIRHTGSGVTDAAGPSSELRPPLRLGGLGGLRVAGRRGQIEDLVRVHDMHLDALRFDRLGDGVQLVRPDRVPGRRAAFGVPQPDVLGAPFGVRADRGRPFHRQAGEMVRICGIRQPGHGGPPAVGGEGEPGVVQGGAAAQDGQAAVRVGDVEHPAALGEKIHRVAAEPPSPGLGVVDGRGVTGGGGRFVESTSDR